MTNYITSMVLCMIIVVAYAKMWTDTQKSNV